MLAVASYRLPALCPKGGAVFPSMIAIGPGSSGTVRYNLETCPYCGAMARIADATFRTIAGDVLAVIQTPSITRTVLLEFSRAAKRAYVEQQPPEVFAQEVEKIDPTVGPDLGAVVRKSGNNKLYPQVLLAIVLAAIGSCSVNVKLDLKLDVNRLVDQLMTTPPAAVIATPEPPVTGPPAPAADPTPDEPGAPKAP